MLSKSLQLGFITPKVQPTGSALFARLKRWLGIVPLDPPQEFAKSLQTRRVVLSECPNCRCDVFECRCQFGDA